MTYLLMAAEEKVGMTAEDLVIRVSENSPYEYLLAATRLAKSLKGKLKFVSDPSGHRATFGRRVSTGTGSGLYYYWV
ncbi:MAG: hypothetical protein ACLRNQ_08535 [Flavonifractor plautii]